MEIGNILQNTNYMSDFELSHKKDKIRGRLQEDSVSISEEALEMAKKMFTQNFVNIYSTNYDTAQSLDEDQNAGDSLLSDYKSYFDQYRGKCLFKDADKTKNSISTDARSSDDIDDGDELSKTASKLERQIRDLASKLEKILSSNIPEAEKETQGNEIQKKISELQSQLAGIKRAITADQNATSSAE